MSIVFLITARLGSTRLPQKHLLPVQGKPILQYLVDSIIREFSTEIKNGDAIVSIATSELPINRKFLDEIRECQVFFGSDGNIPLRHLQAARHFTADAIVSVDGDDIMCSTKAMRAVYDSLKAGSSFVKTEGLPLGMNAMGYRTSVLSDAIDRFGESALLETGWGRVFEGVHQDSVHFDAPPSADLRFTLDYDEDYRFFSAVLSNPRIADGYADAEEIVTYVYDHKLEAITHPVLDAYWQNFRSNIDKEAKETGK